jgi:ApaG protein
MLMNTPPDVSVSILPEYLPEESTPDENEFVFRYKVKLTNHGDQAAKLLERHWIIKDAQEQCQEVMGQGVVGKQPRIEPGKSFEYSSFVVIETDLGTMQGHYQFIADDKKSFSVEVPLFILANPQKLH